MVNPSRCWFGLLHSSSNRIRAKCTGSWGKITPNETGRFHTALNNVKSADATLQNFTPDLQKITHICDISQLCIAITVTNGHDHPRITDTKTNLNLSPCRGAGAYLCTCIWVRFGGVQSGHKGYYQSFSLQRSSSLVGPLLHRQVKLIG